MQKTIINNKELEIKSGTSNKFLKTDSRLNIGNHSKTAAIDPTSLGSGVTDGSIIPSTLVTPSIDWLLYPVQIAQTVLDVNNFIKELETRAEALKNITNLFDNSTKQKARNKINSLKMEA